MAVVACVGLTAQSLTRAGNTLPTHLPQALCNTQHVVSLSASFYVELSPLRTCCRLDRMARPPVSGTCGDAEALRVLDAGVSRPPLCVAAGLSLRDATPLQAPFSSRGAGPAAAALPSGLSVRCASCH